MSKYSKNNSFPCPLPLTLYCDCKQPATISRIYIDTQKNIYFRPTFGISDRPYEKVNEKLYDKQLTQLALDCPEVFKFKCGNYCLSFPYAFSNSLQTFSPAQLIFTVLNSNSFMGETILLGAYRNVFCLADKNLKLNSYSSKVNKDLPVLKNDKSQEEFPPLSTAKVAIKSNFELKAESKVEPKKELATPIKKILKSKNESRPSSAIKGIPEAPKILLKKKS